jgi:hypothetical protein
MLHQGEYVVPRSKADSYNKSSSGGSITVNPVYNVYVQDRAELIRVFNEMQSNLVSEIKRQINVSGY